MVLSEGPDGAPGEEAQPGMQRPTTPRGTLAGDAAEFVKAFIPGAVVVVLAFHMFQSAADRQEYALSAMCASETGWVQEQIERGLTERIAAVAKLAAERSAGADAGSGDALALVRGPSQFRGVLDYDTTLAVRGVTPWELRLSSVLDPRDDAARAVALHAALTAPGDEAIPVLSPPLVTGERQLLICAPVIRGTARSGWVVGVIRLHDLLDADLDRTVKQGFAAAVYDGPTLLYGATMAEGGPGVAYAHDAAMLQGPLLWRVRLWPADELMRRCVSWAPGQLLALGMLLAFCVSLALHLWRRPKRNRAVLADGA